MGLISSGRLFKQKAVYWLKTGDVDDAGQPVYSEPRVIKCRWEDRQEQFADNKGGMFASKAVVYVAEDLSIDGYLWLSSAKSSEPDEAAMAELTSWILENGLTIELNDADSVPNAWAVKRVDKIPDLKAKAKNTLRIVIL